MFKLGNGEGKTLVGFTEPDSGLSDLDSNGNGRPDDGDLYVQIGRVTHNGATRLSMVIDTADYTPTDTGEHASTIFGVTGLTDADFAA